MATITFRNFSSGELSPALYGRTDTAKFQAAVRTMRNMVTLKTSGTSNRPGSKFLGEVKDSSSFVPRLIPFRDFLGQYWLFEFGSQYLRVIKDDAYVTDTSTSVSTITQANPCQVVCSAAHGLSNGNEVQITGVIGMTQLNNRRFKVAGATATTFTLLAMDGTTAIDSTGYTVYSSGGTVKRIFTLVHTFNDNADFPVPKLRRMSFSPFGEKLIFADNGEVPSELYRTAFTNDYDWGWQNMVVGPTIGKPTGLSTGGSGSAAYWVITAVAHNGEESEYSDAATASAAPTPAAPITLTWTAVSGAREYNIYRLATSGYYGWVGTAFTNSFYDSGFTIDLNQTPYKSSGLPWTDSNRGSFHGVVSHGQQRRWLARDTARATTDPNSPASLWISQISSTTNFYSDDPITDSSGFNFTLTSDAESGTGEIRAITEMIRMLVFTSTGEFVLEGNDAGIVTPTAINSRQIGYNGCSSWVKPVKADNKVLYVQEVGNVVRDLVRSGGDFVGEDLTQFSYHLLEGKNIVAMAFQKSPNSVVWIVRDDGVLLGMTYYRDQQIIAWHRHDTDGYVEEVCSHYDTPESAVYIVVRREIDGRTVRYVERLADRYFSDVKDCIFMDAAYSYDGRNTDTTLTMSVPSGSHVPTATFTLTASASYFASTDVGKDIHITGTDGTLYRLAIEGYTSATQVTVRLRAGTLTGTLVTDDWSLAISSITDLWHLEDADVSILGDGFVIGSPNNPDYDTYTVANGTVTLPRPCAVIHVGLPYVSDIETLDIDSADRETLSDKMKIISRVTVKVHNTRGVWVGNNPGDDSLDDMVEAKLRNEEDYDSPVDTVTGDIQINILPEWNSNGRVLIRQVDPLPMTILSISPAGQIPIR